MTKNDELYLRHIIDSIEKIKSYVSNIENEDDFLIDEKTQDAVVRNIEIIGEAASKISQETREKYDLVKWRQIIDTRNLLIHVYFGVSYSAIWNIVVNHIPELENNIRQILHNLIHK